MTLIGVKIMRYPQFHEELAKAIRFHRKKSLLNRQELAKLAGVGKKAIFDLEHAKPTVQLDTLLKVLDALNIQLNFNSPLMETFSKETHAQG